MAHLRPSHLWYGFFDNQSYVDLCEIWLNIVFKFNYAILCLEHAVA
jgi:hypothetical protein